MYGTADSVHLELACVEMRFKNPRILKIYQFSKYKWKLGTTRSKSFESSTV